MTVASNQRIEMKGGVHRNEVCVWVQKSIDIHCLQGIYFFKSIWDTNNK